MNIEAQIQLKAVPVKDAQIANIITNKMNLYVYTK